MWPGPIPETGGGAGGAHLRYGDPWQDPASVRDQARRLRGHMVLPVTVWLAGRAGDQPLCGLTVSSVLVAQGRPPLVAGLVSPDSDLAEVICKPAAPFVVHLLGAGHRRLAQHFSGELPAPAGQLQVEATSHGPVLRAVDDRLACRCLTWKDFGWSVLVEAEVGSVSGGTAGPGLAWYHGSYRTVSPAR